MTPPPAHDAAAIAAIAAFDPSRITDYLKSVTGKVLEPIIKRASEDFYEAALNSAEDFLRENLEHNMTAHIATLERENQRMRTELYEVDRASGYASGHADRLERIARLATGEARGKWHVMLLNLVNAIHKDGGEKTQAIGIQATYDQAMLAIQPPQSAKLPEDDPAAIADHECGWCGLHYAEGAHFYDDTCNPCARSHGLEVPVRASLAQSKGEE